MKTYNEMKKEQQELLLRISKLEEEILKVRDDRDYFCNQGFELQKKITSLLVDNFKRQKKILGIPEKETSFLRIC